MKNSVALLEWLLPTNGFSNRLTNGFPTDSQTGFPTCYPQTGFPTDSTWVYWSYGYTFEPFYRVWLEGKGKEGKGKEEEEEEDTWPEVEVELGAAYG
jgi:hypothetical protein